MVAYTHDCQEIGQRLIDSGVSHLNNRVYDHNDLTGFDQLGVTGKGMSTQVGIEKNTGIGPKGI